MKKLGVIANQTKKGFDIVACRIAEWSKERDMEIIFSDKLALCLNIPVPSLPFHQLLKEIDALIVLGGDGTILSIINDMGDKCKPVLGVNLGHLGFLAEISVERVCQALECLRRGDFELKSRMMLHAKVYRNSKCVKQLFALNEVTVIKGDFARIIELEMFVNDDFVSDYTADGLIIATPTGSTGYSLSAGGPVVAPHMGALIATQICAHTLAVRPLIISDKETFRVRVRSENIKIILTVDGRWEYDLAHNDEVVFLRAYYDATLIHLKDSTFYSVLREKFKWGAREINQKSELI
ncbi:MAG: hypothetical protein B6244_10365 [Candidatus Cloacimonetes bacterium 4572_55]|nr:MAG: hypothetical protein B6244_10365 [Candidatus Cloacimonetes bacterium 4572_55]